MLALIGPAFTIAMLGAIESLLSAVVADGMSGQKHESSTELFGQGLANIVTPLLGGIAATGAIARTATNIRQGGNLPVAGIVHGIVLIAILLFLAPYAVYIPLAYMAAILFVVAYKMSDAPRLNEVPFVDLTSLRVLSSIVEELKKRNIIVLISDANYEIRREMYKTDFLDVLGRHHMWRKFERALKKVERYIETKSSHK